jgi:hypothetical protein
MKLSLNQIYRLTILGTLVLAVAMTLGLFLFLYQYLYKTITETEYIVSLQREYAVEPLNHGVYRKLLEATERRKKKQQPDWERAGNPFLPY